MSKETLSSLSVAKKCSLRYSWTYQLVTLTMNSAPKRSRPRTKQNCCAVLCPSVFSASPCVSFTGKSPFPCLRHMHGDPFKHSPAAAERCKAWLRNAPEPVRTGTAHHLASSPLHLTTSAHTAPPYPRQVASHDQVIYTLIFYHPSSVAVNKRRARLSPPQHSHARRFIAFSALFFVPSFPLYEKAPRQVPWRVVPLSEVDTIRRNVQTG